MARYKTYNTGQHYFDMIDLENSLPSDNRARMIKEIVSCLDTSAFDKNYKNDDSGAEANDARMMLGILLLGCIRNETGSRSLSALCATDLEFKYILSGNKSPDASTIRLFRRRHTHDLGTIFSLTVHLGCSLGLTDFGALAIDGTKIKACASLHKTKDKKKLQKSIATLSKRMEKIIERMNSAENEEIHDALEKRRQNIVKRQSELEDFAVMLQDAGDDEYVNRVDPDARLMTKSDKKPIIGYNAQAAVDCGESNIIVSADVSQDVTDDHLLTKMIDDAEKETGNKFEISLADSGYVTYESMVECAHNKRDILGPDKMYAHDKQHGKDKNSFSKSRFIYDNEDDSYTCPAGKKLEFTKMTKSTTSDLIFMYENRMACAQCQHRPACLSKKAQYKKIHRDYREPLREAIRNRLDSNEGYLLYARRSAVVETVFGQIKHTKKIQQFYHRGLDMVRAEWKLICSGLNLYKIIEHLKHNSDDWRKQLKEALSS